MKSILIIDDEPDIRDLMKIRFESQDIKCLTAEGGKEGVAIAKEQKPTAILLDLIMPEMDGFETYKLLKADERTKRIPIIAFTTQSPDRTEGKGKDAFDVVDFIIKPFDSHTLVMAVKKALAI